MSTDIHMVVQVRGEHGWLFTDVPGFDAQSYRLFAALANVRNGYDIKPIAMPRGLPPDGDYDPHELAQVRLGKYVPQPSEWTSSCDAARAGRVPRSFYNPTQPGSHGQSWLLASEVVAYDWDQLVWNTGYVAGVEWARARAEGTPPQPGAPSVGVSLTEEEATAALERDEDPKDVIGSFEVWRQPLRSMLPVGWERFVGALINLADNYPPGSVRIVFGFDD